jgi:hypothetical protein
VCCQLLFHQASVGCICQACHLGKAHQLCLLPCLLLLFHWLLFVAFVAFCLHHRLLLLLLLQVDPELERKLCNVVAVQLEDQSGDISGLAVKWCVGSVAFWQLGLSRVAVSVVGNGLPAIGCIGSGVRW